MKKQILPLILMSVATPAMFAQETITYDKVISEDTTLTSLQGNTVVKTGATLTMSDNNSTNWNLKIEEGAVFDFTSNSELKLGTGNGPKYNTIENYGTMYMNSGKQMRFDDADGYGTIFNLYSGSTLTTKTGTFDIYTYRSSDTEINVYEGASITNLNNLYTYDRKPSSTSNPTFDFNVAGGTVTQSGSISLGQNCTGYTEENSSIHSNINVTNGGQYTVAGTVTFANKEATTNTLTVSGADSLFKSTGNVNIGTNINSTNTITVKDGGTYEQVKATIALNQGEVNVLSGGIFKVSENPYLNIGNTDKGVASFAIDGGTFDMSGTSDLNISIGRNAGATASFTVTNGGVFQQASGARNTQVAMGAGTSTLEISNGGKWHANTNFTIGNASDSNATMLVDNGRVTGMNGTERTSDIYIANASDATGKLEVSNGGYVFLRTLKMAQGGANAKATLILKGAGSVLKIQDANNIGQSPAYQMLLGMNVADGDKYTGNSAIIEIHTGAQFLNVANGNVYINDSAQVHFVIDTANFANASTAMFSTKNLAINKTDDTVSNPFVIDGAGLDNVVGLKQGDVAEFVIMTVTSDSTFNGDILDFSDAENLIGVFEFKNNTGLVDWEDFGIDNLSWDGSNLTLSLEYVPEPSTYAAIFGALAFAFVAYRRRK